MKNYFAKKSWASYLMIGVLLFAILTLVFSVMSNKQGNLAGSYGVDHMSAVIAYDVVAMVLALAVFAVDGLYINDFINKLISIVVDVVRFLIALFIILAMAEMISSRGTLMGFVWFSSLASGSEQAVAALNDAVVSWVMSVLGLICLMVSCGYNLCEKKAAKATA
ncbi:MAG: hypothetical protein LUE27_03820 [Clostridia bacterium]|nr:hypothetical protein [Clostridia bacterium]